MKRIIVLGSLLLAGTLALSQGRGRGGAAVPPPPLEIEKVKENLYMIKGGCGCGNTAVFITASGVVVVDTKNPNTGKGILEMIKTVTEKPVTMIINTHSHADHTGSNEDFPATVDIVAHENSKVNMIAMANFKDAKAQFLPKKTFKDRMSIGAGADEIDLYYFGPAHTNGDAWIVFPALRAMHSGDAFARKETPIIDKMNGGSAVEFGKTVAKAAAAIKDVDTIIPGHASTTMTFADLKEYASFNTDFITWVQDEIKAGKTVDEAAMEFKIPEKYKGYAVGTLGGGIRGNIQLAYDELKK